jgi:hypothetical protein
MTFTKQIEATKSRIASVWNHLDLDNHKEKVKI